MLPAISWFSVGIHIQIKKPRDSRDWSSPSTRSRSRTPLGTLLYIEARPISRTFVRLRTLAPRIIDTSRRLALLSFESLGWASELRNDIREIPNVSQQVGNMGAPGTYMFALGRRRSVSARTTNSLVPEPRRRQHLSWTEQMANCIPRRGADGQAIQNFPRRWHFQHIRQAVTLAIFGKFSRDSRSA